MRNLKTKKMSKTKMDKKNVNSVKESKTMKKLC